MIIVSHLLYYEEPYLDEWINFHRRQGFKTFYIYLKYGKLTHGSIIPKDDKVYERLVQKYHRYNVVICHNCLSETFYHILSLMPFFS